MAEKISLYLSDEAIAKLDKLAEVLSELAGCKISRSAAVNSILVYSAEHYLRAQRHLYSTVTKYTTGKFAPKETDDEQRQAAPNCD